MQTVQLVSFVAPKLKDLPDLEKIFYEYYTKWGEVEVISTSNDHIQFKVTVNKNPQDLEKWDNKLYQNPIEFTICNHGFFCIKTTIDDELYKKLKPSTFLHFFHELEKKLKRIEGIEESGISLDIPKEAKFTSGSLQTATIEEAFSSHIAKRIRYWNRIITEAKINAESGNTKERMHWIGILDKYSKYVTAYLYKLTFAPKECEILSKQAVLIKAEVSEIVEEAERTKLEAIEKLVGIQKITKTDTKTFHFIYLDIEKFSDVDINIQKKWITILNNIIKNWFGEKDIAPSDYFIITSGDGMVIGFSDDIHLPFLLAKEIQTKLKNRKPRVRIGLATGQVIAFNNIKDQIDYIGPGIIQAHRAMSFGEGEHILATIPFGVQITGLEHSLKNIFKELKDDYAIRPDNKIRLYHVFGKNFGNKNKPKKSQLKP